jgi:MYXO-CTERM domain-containing protein
VYHGFVQHPSPSLRRAPLLTLALTAAPVLLGLVGCAQEGRPLAVAEAELTAAERRVRLTQIRDAAAAAGLTNGVLLAGIAQSETGLAHCWSEATWACQGPASADCGGGPVIAGAGDGPCADMQGGLGMFQFDAGTYDMTLAREGTRILSIAGNVEAAIDFTTSMVIRSVYVDGVDTREQAIAWMNGVVVGGDRHMQWIQTVTHYYNGCVPGRCSVYDSRYASYSNSLQRVWDEMGADFWSMGMAPPCAPVPAAGRVIDDGDACAFLGGDRRYWRLATDAGYGGSLRWTNAITDPEPSNYATWTMRFEAAGRYELRVHTPAPYAESRMTPYRITSAEGTVMRMVDQTAAPLQSLGTYAFEAGADYEVHLGDDSGEPLADMIGIVFDALEIVPVSTAIPDAGDELRDAFVPPGADAAWSDGGDGGTLVTPRPMSASCGCRASGRRSAPPALVALFALGAAVTRRRAART